MNKETIFYIEHLNINLDEIHIPEINECEENIIKAYIEATAHIQIVDDLFKIFLVT